LQMRDVPTTTTSSSSSSSSFATPTPSAIRYSPVTHDDSRQPHTLALLPLPNSPPNSLLQRRLLCQRQQRHQPRKPRGRRVVAAVV
jgi:hypothetical protein